MQSARKSVQNSAIVLLKPWSPAQSSATVKSGYIVYTVLSDILVSACKLWQVRLYVIYGNDKFWTQICVMTTKAECSKISYWRKPLAVLLHAPLFCSASQQTQFMQGVVCNLCLHINVLSINQSGARTSHRSVNLSQKIILNGNWCLGLQSCKLGSILWNSIGSSFCKFKWLFGYINVYSII